MLQIWTEALFFIANVQKILNLKEKSFRHMEGMNVEGFEGTCVQNRWSRVVFSLV